MDGVLDARIISGDGRTVGTHGRERMRLGPRTYDAEFEVSAVEPDRRIAWRVAGGVPFSGELALELTPMGDDRTQAIYVGTLRMKGIWRLLEPLMAREMQAGPARELERLKALVESTEAR